MFLPRAASGTDKILRGGLSVLKKILSLLLFILIIFFWRQPQEAAGQSLKRSSVPGKYKTLYVELDKKLQEIDRYILG